MKNKILFFAIFVIFCASIVSPVRGGQHPCLKALDKTVFEWLCKNGGSLKDGDNDLANLDSKNKGGSILMQPPKYGSSWPYILDRQNGAESNEKNELIELLAKEFTHKNHCENIVGNTYVFEAESGKKKAILNLEIGTLSEGLVVPTCNKELPKKRSISTMFEKVNLKEPGGISNAKKLSEMYFKLIYSNSKFISCNNPKCFLGGDDPVHCFYNDDKNKFGPYTFYFDDVCNGSDQYQQAVDILFEEYLSCMKDKTQRVLCEYFHRLTSETPSKCAQQ
jgi:hypothetical protein